MALDTSDKLTDESTVIDESFQPYFTDVYKPGEIKEQLEIGKEVKGEIKNYISPTVHNGTYTSSYTGLVTVPTLATPKMIRFTFFQDTDWATWSEGNITSTSQQCIARKFTLTTNKITPEFRPTDAFYIQEFVSSSACVGNVNIITNGFTIQATQNTFSINLKWIAECFY